ncbi:MAG: hypothetical protein ACOCV2_04115 [Persicimonas sp.]
MTRTIPAQRIEFGWLKWSVAAILTAGFWLVCAPDAHAQSIQESSIDRAVTVEPKGEFAERQRNGRLARIGRDHCRSLWDNETPIRFTFTFNQAVAGTGADVYDGTYFFAVQTDEGPSDFECDTEDSNNCERAEEDWVSIPNSDTIEVRIPFRDLMREPDDGEGGVVEFESGEDCERTDDPIQQRYFVRIFLEDQSVIGGEGEVTDAVVELDTSRPTAPESLEVRAATEANLYLEWEQDNRNDIERYHAFWDTEDFSDMTIDELEESEDISSRAFQPVDDDPDGSTFEGEVEADGLDADDDQVVYVALASESEYENLSEATFAEEGVEVMPVTDFWEGYQDAGGNERGGCSAAPTGAVPGEAVFGLAILFGGALWRRRR